MEQRKTRPDGSAASQEHEQDGLPPYAPMTLSIDDIRRAIPPHLFKRSASRATSYIFRDVACAIVAWALASRIDGFCRYLQSPSSPVPLDSTIVSLLRWSLWSAYWWFQGLIFTGFWVIGHEAGHGGLSDSTWFCSIVGFICHSGLLTPYFGWKVSHHHHHMNHGSMERDETWIPLTRSEMNLPPEDEKFDYEEYFGDAPIWTLGMLVLRQVIAFPVYLLFNVSGNKDYPKWTNHFDPNSVLFKKSQRNKVILSDLGVVLMICVLQRASMQYGFWPVMKFYGVPWLWVSHWLVMITYLHHTDPELPHYRNAAWTFSRGASATMDRDFLGWQGQFFLHGISHHHVTHHYFPKMPFWHCDEATPYVRKVVGEEHYWYSDKPTFMALWDNYNQCQFVEDNGSVIFYRDKKGQAVRKAAAEFET
ncbi:hypothetical protein PHLGIDRAFT_107540 [Phlebiopsis gigantea 11061_1 CR5-6]|uniref:Fatty acid desaturase domain-containing protein n=1 Tax=Phlebiopsis gigantea (strain 11061_1 CR5-6) TaxID=745531 RepID=A0A0C3RWJ1_PHLG1|nr:hypothetical protein PHLGIDRAFT_107540 [Phlebiopsis gigantea 11061_1 CR5-6]